MAQNTSNKDRRNDSMTDRILASVIPLLIVAGIVTIIAFCFEINGKVDELSYRMATVELLVQQHIVAPDCHPVSATVQYIPQQVDDTIVEPLVSAH